MINGKLYSILFLLLFLIFGNGCNSYKTDESLGLQKVLAQSDSDSIEFSFSELLGADCDYYIIILPYTYLDRLSDTVEVELEKLASTGIEKRDDIYRLACIKNNTLIDQYLLFVQRVKLVEMNDLQLHDINRRLALKKQNGKYVIRPID